MNKELTEVICIVDRSGSMGHMRDEAIGGFNAFLKKQQESTIGQCRMTYVQFDEEIETLFSNVDIKHVAALNEDTFVPRGMTALYDAVGKTINEVGERLRNTPEAKRPGAVVMVILTDGLNNASHKFTKDKVKTMVEHQANEYNWNFIFLGQNIDSSSVGGGMGVNSSHRGMLLCDVPTGKKGALDQYAAVSCALDMTRRKVARGESTSYSVSEKSDFDNVVKGDEDKGA